MDEFEKNYAGMMTKKLNMLSKLSNEKLEGLLKSQTQNSVAMELMSTIIPYAT